MPAKINNGGKQDFLSPLINLMDPCWIKVYIYLTNKSYGPQIFEQFLKSNVVHK